MKKYVLVLFYSYVLTNCLYSQKIKSDTNYFVGNVKIDINNHKRYQIEKGKLEYFMFTVNKKGKKNKKLYLIIIQFDNYGENQNVDILMNDSVIRNYQIRGNKCDTADSVFVLNYFVYTNSIYYKGLSAMKERKELFQRIKCIRFILYDVDLYSKRHRGTVMFHLATGLPVYVRGGVIDSKEIFIWELQTKLKNLFKE